jgi:hypothetical protein
MEIRQTTGNKIVDAVAKMQLTGNIVHEAWYHTVTKKNGKCCPLAVLILADIVYWYRPAEHRDEETQAVTYYKKFHDNDYLQRSYAQIMSRYGISKKQAYEALVLLEELGVVKRHFRTITTSGGNKMGNVMFLELIPEVLMELTYPNEAPIAKNVNSSLPGGESIKPSNPDEAPIAKNVNSSLPVGNDLIPNKSIPPYENGNTNTKTTTEDTPEIPSETPTTTTEKKSTDTDDTARTVVDKVRDAYADLELPDNDIIAIVKASGNNFDRCIQARLLLDLQCQKIYNVTGWLIKALNDKYQMHPKAGPRSGFANYEQRHYTKEDFELLENLLAAQ